MKTRLASALLLGLPLLAACDSDPDPFDAPAPPTVAVRSAAHAAAGDRPHYAMKIYRVVGSGADTAVVLHSAIHVTS